MQVRYRLSGVPREAVWYALAEEWCLVRSDDRGRLMGLETRWYSDAVVKARRHFWRGRLHGCFAHYHDNGEVARAGTFVWGRRHGIDKTRRCTQRSRVPWDAHDIVATMLGPLAAFANDVWGINRLYVRGHLRHVTLIARDSSIVVARLIRADPRAMRTQRWSW